MEIRTTACTGRSYYSTVALPENSCVLDISTPYTYVIYKQFRNEVCSECFKYDGGRRTFLTCREYGEHAGLLFCDDHCRDSWLAREGPEAVGLLTRLEGARWKGKQKADDEQSPPLETDKEDIERAWIDIQRREQNMKELRRWKLLSLDDFQADLARYVLLALHHLFRELSSRSDDTAEGSDAGGNKNEPLTFGGADWSLFTSLQSNEAARISEFADLLDDNIKIYQVLKGLFSSERDIAQWDKDKFGISISTSDIRTKLDIEGGLDVGDLMPQRGITFSNLITAENVRKVLGVDAGNSFGIWETPLMDNSELLGFGVYPVPSFFNHNCSPNLISACKGRDIRFLTTKSVAAGEQLCISYGHVENMPVKERRKQLLDGWFFECMCEKCQDQLVQAQD